MTKIRGCTRYQLEILQAIAKHRESEGLDIDLDLLLDGLSWQPTKQSLQFSIRALVAKKMIAKNGTATRRGRKRVVFCLLQEGQAVLDPRVFAPRETVSENLHKGPEELVPGGFLEGL